MTIKDLKYLKINSVNPLYLIINKVNRYFEEINKSNFLTLVPTNESKWNKLLQSTYHYTKLFLLHNTNILMMIIYQLSVYFILIIFNDLSNVSINISVTLPFAAVLELLLQTFDRFFLSRFILMSYFTLHIFLQLMLLVLMEGFCLNAQGGYRYLFFKDVG